MFPQKYDGRSLPPEVNQGCGEGRRGGGPHGWEADLPGCTLRREESEEEEYGERLWLDIVFEKLSFVLLFTVASLLCYGVLVGK